MSFSEFKTRKSEDKQSVPYYIKIMKLRKTIGSFTGILVILAIIGQFITYSFWHSVLFSLIFVVAWYIINIILNLIFTPIISSLIKQYSEK